MKKFNTTDPKSEGPVATATFATIVNPALGLDGPNSGNL